MEKSLAMLCIAGVCADLIFSRIPFIPKAGEESYAEDFTIKAGGGANTPMAAAKLGLETGLLSIVGHDPMGDMLLRLIGEAGINTDTIVQSRHHATSVSAVLSLHGGERAFASYDKLCLNTLPARMLMEKIASARHIHTHVGYCDSLPILSLAQKHGCTVSLDTSFNPHQSLSALIPHLGQATIFSPNEQEACQLAQTADVAQAAQTIGRYVPYLLIKLGSKGALLHHKGQTTYYEGFQAHHALDTTGAGDNFIAGFLYGFLNHLPLSRCMDYANASGALSVTFLGGTDDSYTKEKVVAMVNGEKKEALTKEPL